MSEEIQARNACGAELIIVGHHPAYRKIHCLKANICGETDHGRGDQGAIEDWNEKDECSVCRFNPEPDTEKLKKLEGLRPFQFDWREFTVANFDDDDDPSSDQD